MPNKESAKKRVKIAEKKNLRNRIVKSRIKTAIKKFNATIMSNDAAGAEALLPETFSIIDSAVSKGVIHKNNAANKKAALAKTLNDLKTGKLVIPTVIDHKTRIAEKRAAEEKARQEAKEAREQLRAQKEAEKEAKAKKTKKAESKEETKKAKKAEKVEKEKETDQAEKEK
ncbi:MAG TPA: 30S ribosomal protein S20 [Clostridiales bacterium]|nr:30S ribosomal protein S20 [Clostridiales bacterium]